MSTTPEHPTDRLGRLQETANVLVREIDELSRESGTQIVSLTRRARSARRMIWGLSVSVALDIVLSVSMILVVVQVRHNENATAAITHRLDIAQTITRQKTLCPLYGVLLAAENPKARAAFPQGPDAYDHTFAVIREGYDALNCAEFVAPPTVDPQS